MAIVRGAKWRAVKEANPGLTDEEVDGLIRRAVEQERELVLKGGLNLDQAREITREDLFPTPTEEENSPTEDQTPA